MGAATSIFERNKKRRLSYLRLTIAATSNPLRIEATITNTHPTKTFSVLTWDSPLSEIAFKVGVFSINRLGDEDKKMRGPGFLLNRRMPPNRDSIVEIAPGDSASQQFEIPLDHFPLQSGQTYRIRAAGNYRIVWPHKVKRFGRGEIMLFLLGGRGLRGGFESNEVEFVAP